MSFTDELKKKLEVSKEYLKEHPEMWQAYKLSVEMEDGIDNIQNVLVETDDNGKPVGFRVDFKVGVTKKEAEQDMARFCQGVGSKEGYKLERNLSIDRKVYVGFADVPEYKSQEQLFMEGHPDAEKFYMLKITSDTGSHYFSGQVERPTDEIVDQELDKVANECEPVMRIEGFNTMTFRIETIEVTVKPTGETEHTVVYAKERVVNK
jgi:hypothetical protein